MKSSTLWKSGEFENVSLSIAEHAKLCEKYSETAAKLMIEEFSERKAARGLKYKSDYAAILTWARAGWFRGIATTRQRHVEARHVHVCNFCEPPHEHVLKDCPGCSAPRERCCSVFFDRYRKGELCK